jgi:hypothetical protein
MFMEIAIAAIGIGIVLMVGYILLAQVKTALPIPTRAYDNACYGHLINSTVYCNTTAINCGPTTDNTSLTLTCNDAGYVSGTASTQVTVFAGFGLIAVGIIVLAAFGLISVFK